MFEWVKSEKKVREKMRDDEELEMLLGEIPHVTSLNNHILNRNGDDRNLCSESQPPSHFRYLCHSPVSLALHSNGSSSSSLISSGNSLSDYGSSVPSPMEEMKSPMFCKNTHYPNGSMFDLEVPIPMVGKKFNENMIDEVGLSSNFRSMYIRDEPVDVSLDTNGYLFFDHNGNAVNTMNLERIRVSDNHRNAYSSYGVIPSAVGRNPKSVSEMSSNTFALQQAYRLGSPLGSQVKPGQGDGLSFQSNCTNGVVSYPHQTTKEQAGYYWQRGMMFPITSPSVGGAMLCSERDMNLAEERGTSNLPSNLHLTHKKSHLHLGRAPLRYPPILDGRMRASNISTPRVSLDDYMEDSLIIPGEGVHYMTRKGFGNSKGRSYKNSSQESSVAKPNERSQLNDISQFLGTTGIARNSRLHCPFSLPLKFNTLAEAQGYIYLMAKDQHGCRFLQRIFDEGTSQDVQIIFNEITDHVVELMMNPFGNYLMQKLLEVCNEEQRMQILLLVTERPSKLVQISLNTHGTRVVQKLIETLKTRQQISLVISAIESGFLILIKDLNGNHVVQRCLQCLSTEDNKFIFLAAAKHCVEIATHQHGCCVLQRCISHLTGELREYLLAEISSNGLLLAQDAFGNYVVQYIIEQKFPYAISKLVSQFAGNYVHLSVQKFSSHVVEKCLLGLSDKVKSKIIHELLSANHFEQLLQDPHANYVVQTALRISQGPLHNMLVEAIESHKSASRSNPYSKRIFTHKLLKKYIDSMSINSLESGVEPGRRRYVKYKSNSASDRSYIFIF